MTYYIFMQIWITFSYKDQPELMERYFENINLEIVYCEDTPHSMLVYGTKKNRDL